MKLFCSLLDREARNEILEAACGLGYAPCLMNASMMFQKFMEDPVNNK